MQAEDAEKVNFLDNQESSKPANNQSRMKIYSGLEWMCREILKEVANSAVAMGEVMQGVADWEEWSGEEKTFTRRRSEREEKYLWAMLRVWTSRVQGRKGGLKTNRRRW